MAKIKPIVVVLGSFSVIGIIHGIILDSFALFITWFLIGLWLIFTFKVFRNIKRYRSFNSPHNTAFFVILPLFVGIFYSIWGYFTGLFGENLIEGSNLYLSLWSLMLGIPYIIYGSISLNRCFKKYNVIYFGTKSIKAGIFGYILGFLVLFVIIAFWASFYSIIDFYDSLFIPLHFSIDVNLLMLFITTLCIIIISGFLGSQPTLPSLNRDYIRQRVNRVNNLVSPRRINPVKRERKHKRTETKTTQTPSERTINRTSRSVSQSSRSTPTTQKRSSSSRTKTSTKTSTKKSVSADQSKTKRINLGLYKPKAKNLSLEDFKCIFCFNLPENPKDKGRGIILCPKCKYPAHADEFKDWLDSSGLCSRCNSPIPSSFKRNPKILSVKNYIFIYKSLLKNK